MNTIRQAAMAVVEAGGRVEYAIALDALRVEADRMEAEQDALKNKINAIVNAVEQANEKIQAEAYRMEAELETVLKDRIALAKEVDELRAKLAAMEKQEPVAYTWRFSDGDLLETPMGTLQEIEREWIGYDGEPVPLYLSAGAKE
jgi:septal ring factor EnvC (AmiA/AmiB activator)